MGPLGLADGLIQLVDGGPKAPFPKPRQEFLGSTSGHFIRASLLDTVLGQEGPRERLQVRESPDLLRERRPGHLEP
ncbi:MAG: hypothetical protein E6K75_01625, partial [Candidatus Eisenbacteria bacterium]